MLQQQGLSATQTQIATALANPTDTVVVVVGDLTTANLIFERQLDPFVDAGGALLVASDSLSNTRVPGQPVNVAPIRGCRIKRWNGLSAREVERHGFEGYDDCAVVTRFDREGYSDLFNGVDSIVANRPGRVLIQGQGRNTRPAAWLPPGRRYPLVAISRSRLSRDGRMIIVADHSLFVNEMLIHADNARFASNVAEWLCRTTGEKRSTLVLVHDGKVHANWGLGETPPAIPLETLLKAVQSGGLSNLPLGDSLLPVVNDAIEQAQAQNVFNEVALQGSRQVFGYQPNRWLIPLTAIFAVLALGWFLRARFRPRLWMSYRDWRQPTEPRVVGAVREQHYRPYLRTVIREFFHEGGAPGLDPDHPPHVRGETGGIVERDVHELWNFATSPNVAATVKKAKKEKLGTRDVERFLGTLRRLRQLQLQGNLKLEWAIEN